MNKKNKNQVIFDTTPSKKYTDDKAKCKIKKPSGALTIQQNQETNHLTLLIANDENTSFEGTQYGDIVRYNGFSVRVNNYEAYTSSTKQTLLAFTTAFYYQKNFNNKEMYITLNDFMTLRGKIKNKSRVKKEIIKDVKTLLSMHITKDGQSGGTNIFQSCIYDTESDCIKVHFTEVYGASLRASPLMNIHHSLLQLEQKEHNIFQLGYHLTMLNHFNRGIISVQNLLEKTNLPSYEIVKENMKSKYNERIIAPLENCLDKLQKLGILDSWSYQDFEFKGKNLKGPQLKKFTKIFFSGNLQIEYKIKRLAVQCSLFFDI